LIVVSPTFAAEAESSKMRKRAVDLSLEELAAMGANAALKAAQKARDAGLVVTGTVDVVKDGRIISSLAERRPSGAVALLDVSGAGTSGNSEASKSGKPDTGKPAD
jgi:hydroxyethylthiazole kinase-like sugar kinase family protein